MNEKESCTAPQPPPGLEALYAKCRALYPDQTNPLQVTAIIKYWLGGPDPLDYISMYANPGDADRGIPAHWHYISFGLSDLHGDGRVHESNTDPDGCSGLGFELTIRLKRGPQESTPPTWPAALLQSLARYVFQSGNSLCDGDHVSWHCALDNSKSRLQHMLMATDAQLTRTQTPFGWVDFVQVVGVCAEELHAGQKWLGKGVLQMLSKLPRTDQATHISKMDPDFAHAWTKIASLLTMVKSLPTGCESPLERFCADSLSGDSHPVGNDFTLVSKDAIFVQVCAKSGSIFDICVACTGGPWLVTDMSRQQSIFELDPGAQDEVERGFEEDGSNLSGVSARCSWQEIPIGPIDDRGAAYSLNSQSSEKHSEENSFPFRGHLNTIDSGTGTDTSSDSHNIRTDSGDLKFPVKRLRGVHITFNLEAGNLLPLAIRGRVRHGRHFTFKSVLDDQAVTLVAESVTGTQVTRDQPYALLGKWLQVLIPNELEQQMTDNLKVLAHPEKLVLPKTFAWPERHLVITIVSDSLVSSLQ